MHAQRQRHTRIYTCAILTCRRTDRERERERDRDRDRGKDRDRDRDGQPNCLTGISSHADVSV